MIAHVIKKKIRDVQMSANAPRLQLPLCPVSIDLRLSLPEHASLFHRYFSVWKSKFGYCWQYATGPSRYTTFPHISKNSMHVCRVCRVCVVLHLFVCVSVSDALSEGEINEGYCAEDKDIVTGATGCSECVECSVECGLLDTYAPTAPILVEPTPPPVPPLILTIFAKTLDRPFTVAELVSLQNQIVRVLQFSQVECVIIKTG